MGSVKVTVYGRIRPCPKNTQCQEYSIKRGDSEDVITFSSVKVPAGKKTYRFQKIFDEDATQEEIFRIVAKPVIENVFSGFNGTIFTYGQTGSGKTFTMTGDIEKWEYPGLIPRTLQEIFHGKGEETVVSITYCEIYNEHVYDLIRLDRIESDVPQVSLLEDSSGITHFRNLSVHNVDTIYDALQLLVVGDANKMVAETASNAKSSRSHVIFSITLDLPHPMHEKLSLKPVLYLVDLAGSEKLSKCKASSNNPWETRYINLSLHYLEQVLIALRQPGRVHIPYRNSLMTALLRNSLGGNCFTAMIATFSLSMDDVEETIQTCRFAERIALIKNQVKLNEIANPQKEIEVLKRENERLKAQLKLLGNEQTARELNTEEKEMCVELVTKYIQGNENYELPLFDLRKMEFCCSLMRDEIHKKILSEDGAKTASAADTFDAFKICQQKTISQGSVDLTKLSSVRVNGVEKNWRKKRNPVEMSKLNITYKRWKSTEQILDRDSANKNGEESQPESANVSTKPAGSKVSSKTSRKGKFSEEKLLDLNAGQEVKNTASSSRTLSPKRDDNQTISSTNLPGIYSQCECDFQNRGLSLKSSTENPGKLLNEENMDPGELGLFKNFQNAVKTQIDREDDGVEIEKELHYIVSNGDTISVTSNNSQISLDCLPLTGDLDVDEEIIKFYKTRYNLFRNK